MIQRISILSRYAKERLPEGADLDLAGGYYRQKLCPSEVGPSEVGYQLFDKERNQERKFSKPPFQMHPIITTT